jgi:hypothetical protein
MVAKPCSCDTRQGLRMRGCGVVTWELCRASDSGVCGVSGTFLGWAAVVGESPVRENITRVVVMIPE